MPKGSVLFTSRAPIGYTAIAANPIATNQGFKSVVPHIIECNRYIAVYFKAFADWIDDKASGTTFREVSGKTVANLPFPLPPLAEQHRIVAKVEELMTLCDRLEAAQEQCEKRRNAFVLGSLESIDRNVTGSTPLRRQVAPLLRQLNGVTTKKEHVERLKETVRNLAVCGALTNGYQWTESTRSTTGELPGGWEISRLADFCEFVTSGSRSWAQFYANSGANFIRAQNIRFGKLSFENLAFVRPPESSEGLRTRAQEGDLLVVITGAGVTNPALVDRDPGEAYVSQHVALIRPKDSRMSQWLLLCLMAPLAARRDLINAAYGAGKPGLNLENLRSLKLPIPPLPEQKGILEAVYRVSQICDSLATNLEIARARKHQLLESVIRAALSPAPTTSTLHASSSQAG